MPVPQFFNELNYAHEKNLSLSKVQSFADEDDDRMNGAEPLAPNAPPMSVAESVEAWGLHESLKENLQSMEVRDFFPVQRAVIPAVIRDNAASFLLPRDMCISAPTGSGKTLAYAVPIVQSLLRYDIRRLRALVLLPSRELAVQVHKVFESVAKGTQMPLA